LFSGKNNNFKEIKTVNLNFGPQHPAAHGVLRLILQLNGEIVEKLDPHIGLLHRGTEKLIENKNYLLNVPYFDRLDYCSMLTQEHAFCLAIEKLAGNFNFSSNFIKIRTLFDEITRIINHLLAVACHALDVGSMSSVFWGFEEREKLMEFYERVSGARMHAAFYRPNEINQNAISENLLEDIIYFSRNFFSTMNEMHNVLTYNKIWKQRLINIGVLNFKNCFDYGLSGVMSRSTGIKKDLRLSKNQTYANYYNLNFRSFIGQNGDSYDRFLIRMNEMLEASNIINQSVDNLLKKKKNVNKFVLNNILNFELKA
jgi:NADH:ubiquinone oxidoreductase subunit D